MCCLFLDLVCPNPISGDKWLVVKLLIMYPESYQISSSGSQTETLTSSSNAGNEGIAW